MSFNPATLCPLTTDAALRRAVALAPEVEAIVGPGGRLTYAELEAEVARIRSGLAGLGYGGASMSGCASATGRAGWRCSWRSARWGRSRFR